MGIKDKIDILLRCIVMLALLGLGIYAVTTTYLALTTTPLFKI
jgi:hypothetical protein